MALMPSKRDLPSGQAGTCKPKGKGKKKGK